MKYLFSLLFFMFTFKGFNQSVTPIVKAVLPAIVDESSGLETNSRNKIWTHNDSGGNSELYETDSTGNLIRTLQITNAINDDWEDLAQDSSGNYYIGNFGNNNNDRQDLKIYKIPNPDSISGNTVNADVINFIYPDQNAFPPPNAERNFDAEAFIAMNNSLYIFTKNHTNPFNGYTKLYKLPDGAGTYVAQLLDSFYAGPGPYPLSSVTAAEISPDHSHLFLLGYTQCWLFSNFSGEDFFSGTVQNLTFNGAVTQKEGACFISNTELYLSDELNMTVGGNLYYLDLQAVINGTNNYKNEKVNLSVGPNPFTDHLTILTKTKINCPVNIKIYNMMGSIIYSKSIFIPENKIDLPTDLLSEGLYLLEVATDKNILFSRKIVKNN
jgi:hypothetical protein